MVFDKSKFLSHKTEKLVYQELKKMGFNIKLHETIYKSSRKTHFKIDLYIQDLNLCIEIDGNQHFRDLLMFYNSQGYEIQLNRDVFKMQKMQEKNISCIRLIQMECWNGKSTWIQNNLIPLIKRYETTQQIYIETTSQYKNIYDEHKMHMNHCLTESDLYLE